MTFERICVYCGSNPGAGDTYLDAARTLGRTLAEQGIDLVYGGAQRGLMGAMADAALSAGGQVIGVIPQSLVDMEIAHRGLTELHVVSSMHERKAEMTRRADGFLILPGGWGTLDELCEAMTWAQLGIHRKPCGLWNINGYYDRFFQFLEHAVQEGFLRADDRALLLANRDLAGLLESMAAFRPRERTRPLKLS